MWEIFELLKNLVNNHQKTHKCPYLRASPFSKAFMMLALTCFMSRQSDLSSFLCEPTKYSLNLILAANTVKHIYFYKQYTWNINAVCVLLEKIIHLKTMFYMEQN